MRLLERGRKAHREGEVVAMADEGRVLFRREEALSAWVRLVTKKVEFAPGEEPRVYHCLAQPDYITILARTPDGRIQLVGQFRPAVEAYTWELPAGLLEAGEDPEEACRRELRRRRGWIRLHSKAGEFLVRHGPAREPSARVSRRSLRSRSFVRSGGRNGGPIRDVGRAVARGRGGALQASTAVGAVGAGGPDAGRVGGCEVIAGAPGLGRGMILGIEIEEGKACPRPLLT